jgi:hypothetical protein
MAVPVSKKSVNLLKYESALSKLGENRDVCCASSLFGKASLEAHEHLL